VLAFIGVVLSSYSSVWCEFVDVDLPLDGQGNGGTISYGPWRAKSFVLLVDEDGDYWKVDTCDPISDNWDIDAKWKLARACTIISPILGAIGGAALYTNADATAGILLLAALFQGLVMIFLQSNACDGKDPAIENLPTNGNFDGFGDCELGGSAIMAIVATCVFFVAAFVAAALGRMIPSDDDVNNKMEDSNPPKEEGEAEMGEKHDA
jgi:hypothetical protein